MKKVVLIVILSVMNICLAQKKLVTRAGITTFEASVPAFEEVKAVNNATTVVVNADTGEIACLNLIKGFRFKVALMEEHFNENYIESDKYPKSIFKGKIEKFDINSLTTTPKEFALSGKLELHGKTNDVNIKAKISKNATGILLVSNFFINANDYNVAIPNLVKSKVSNKVNVNIQADLK